MASELVVDHNLCRFGIMATTVATVHRVVRTTYTCTITPLSFPWSWNTPLQVSYNGGGKLGAIRHLGDNLSRRSRRLLRINKTITWILLGYLVPLAFLCATVTLLPCHFPNFFSSTLSPFGGKKSDFTWMPTSLHLSWMVLPTTADDKLFFVLIALGPIWFGSSLAPRPYLNNRSPRRFANVVYQFGQRYSKSRSGLTDSPWTPYRSVGVRISGVKTPAPRGVCTLDCRFPMTAISTNAMLILRGITSRQLSQPVAISPG